MTPSSHTHACAKCGATYNCDGELVPTEQADGYLKAVCYFFHLQGLDKCGLCEAPQLRAPAPDLERMVTHPNFGVIRRFSEDDWMVVFQEPVGRHWRGTSLADVVQKWRAQYERSEVA